MKVESCKNCARTLAILEASLQSPIRLVELNHALDISG